MSLPVRCVVCVIIINGDGGCVQVVCDEHVIDEGDDGDNFYVIDT